MGRHLTGETDMTRRRLVLLAVIVEALLGLVALVGGWLLKLPMGEWVVWSATGLLWGLGGTVVLLAILLLCRRFPVGPIGKLMRLVDERVAPVFRECRLIDLLIIAVLAGAGEELLFRGLIQGGLECWLVPWWGESGGTMAALVVAGVVFGVAHWISREYAVFATVLGLVLGSLAVVTGDLLASMAAHAGYDFVALLILTKGRGNAEEPE
jgi:membrane protease YdiL (CAAX protease family)